jgi:hypothetical protein
MKDFSQVGILKSLAKNPNIVVSEILASYVGEGLGAVGEFFSLHAEAIEYGDKQI